MYLSITLVESDSKPLFLISNSFKGHVFQHISSKTCLAPKASSPHPAEGNVVIHTSNCKDLSAFFRILDNGAIQHEQSGLCIHLSGNRKIPKKRDIAILKSGILILYYKLSVIKDLQVGSKDKWR